MGTNDISQGHWGKVLITQMPSLVIFPLAKASDVELVIYLFFDWNVT